MNARFLLLFLAFATAHLTAVATDLTWPKVDRETRPWSRWWWLGSILTEEGIHSEMEKYRAAGLGGLEITPIYGVRGHEDQFIQYLSPTWMNRLTFVLSEARRLDLGIDMATGNGWPFGGPWVEEEDAARYVAHKTFKIAAGQALGERIEYIQEPVVRYAGPARPAIEELKRPITANENLQALALDQVRYPVPLPLQLLMAYPDQGGAPVNVTDRVDAQGRLDWTPPADSGNWTLHGVFLGWHGKLVERAGPGGEGYVIDHFDSEALQKYLRKFEEAYVGHDISSMRGYFNDSYEVDDASGESNWTEKFFEEFQRRRGYDLRLHIPLLFPAEPSEASARVISDHRETISDLLLEEFTKPWQQWAADRGAIIRNQAHGSPANILDLYAASDIPEQEGSNILSIKMASSAAHVTGKRLASSEAATWLNEHFIGTLAETKNAVDRFLLGGINHNCYHGTAYSPPGEEWPGFHFYASVELNPSNPQWDHFGALNAYVTRAQSFLQAGQSDEDVLLYYNIHDRWMVPGNGAMPHFHGPQGPGASEAGRDLLAGGYGFDYISDRLLSGVRYANGALRAGNSEYKAIVVSNTTYIPADTMRQLFVLAERGATILFHGTPPSQVPGYGRLNQRRSQLQVYTETLAKIPADNRPEGVATLNWGQGRILIGEDLQPLLTRAGVARESMVDQGLGYVRRQDGSAHHYFISNRGEQAIDGWVPLATPSRSVAVFDLMTGKAGVGATRVNAEGGTDVYVQLAPGESWALRTSADEARGERHVYRRAQGQPQPLTGTWSVSFVKGGPELPAPVQVTELKSWTEFGGDAVKNFSGVARYTLTFDRPQGAANGYILDLGRVAESAQVRLNGEVLTTLFSAPYRLELNAGQLRDRNTLEIEVANLMANRAADLDRRGVAWKKFYNINMPARRPANRGPDGNFSAAGWDPLPSGLIGPVTLTAAERIDPAAQAGLARRQ